MKKFEQNAKTISLIVALLKYTTYITSDFCS